MTHREPSRDNPWLLALLGTVAVVALVAGCLGWTWILDGPAR